MRRSGFTLVEMLIVIVIISILAGLLIPVVISATICAKKSNCLSNLRQIGQMSLVYRKGYGGRQCDLPHETGAAWHRKLMATVLKGKSAEVFDCPLEGDPSTRPDYRGPAKDVNVRSSYEPEDAIAGDRLGNHGDPNDEGVNALTLSHSVFELKPQDAERWSQFLSGTLD
jgi:prepilin-type N-terminal cleavage/methylation domain-containing protein